MSEKNPISLRYRDKGNVHMDFHGATNTTIDFIIEKALCKFSDLKKTSVKFTYSIVKLHPINLYN